MAELTLELEYFSVLYEDEEPEWVVVLRGDLVRSCTIFPCYLGMEINAKTQWTTTKIVELGN